MRYARTLNVSLCFYSTVPHRKVYAFNKRTYFFDLWSSIIDIWYVTPSVVKVSNHQMTRALMKCYSVQVQGQTISRYLVAQESSRTTSSLLLPSNSLKPCICQNFLWLLYLLIWVLNWRRNVLFISFNLLLAISQSCLNIICKI